MIPRHLKISLGIFIAATLFTTGYVWWVRRHAAKTPLTSTAELQKQVSPPLPTATEHVVLYVADDARGVLTREDETIALPADPAARARELLRALLGRYTIPNSSHPLPSNAEIVEAYLVQGNLAVVNMNSAFADSHRSGVLVEELTVLSLVQTLAANIPNIMEVKILVDGKERETLAGHADLSNFYATAVVGKVIDQLQNR